MQQRSKKTLLLTSLLTLITSVAILAAPVSAQAQRAIIKAPVLLDTAKTPGSTFPIDITIDDVEKLWGYQFFLYYNTSVLTATSYDTYAPFTVKQQASINDTAGWIFLAYSYPFGETVGFATEDDAPIAKI